ncbi:MAG TPA: metal-dependent hydrolase, partial [Nitrospiria bacterium]|nr:metal-dependent hydrolase [Nitrospiria bacterium]
MDPVTHTLVGVGMANAFFRKRIGPPAVPVLALASNLPDIDAVVHLTGDPTAILMRRTFGHSVFLLPLWSLCLALILRRFYPQVGFGRLFGLTLLGAFVHLFFDLVNSFGVVLLWPFSDWRPELAIIFIIDLILTGLLAAPLLLSVFRRLRPHLVLMSRIAMAGVAVYILFCEGNRMIARQALASESAQLTPRPEFSYVFPEPLGPHRWRGVVRTGDRYSI